MIYITSNKMDIRPENPVLSSVNLSIKMKELENAGMMNAQLPFDLVGERARVQGLNDMVNHHPIIVSASSYRMLNSGPSSNEMVTRLSLQLTNNNIDKAKFLLRSNILDPAKIFISIHHSPAIQIPDYMDHTTLYKVMEDHNLSSPTLKTATSGLLSNKPSTDRRFTQSITLASRQNQAQTQAQPHAQPQTLQQGGVEANITDQLPSSRPTTTLAGKTLENINMDILETEDISVYLNSGRIDEILPTHPVDEHDLSVNSITICAVCQEDKASMRNNLITCTRCNQSYHTTCMGMPAIPYNNLREIERRNRDAYVCLMMMIMMKNIIILH